MTTVRRLISVVVDQRVWISVFVAVAALVYVVILDVLGLQPQRSIRSAVFLGIVAGGALGFITAQSFARLKATKVNGWITMFGCGVPGNGMLFRTACALLFPGPVNVPQEAMYWTTSKDGAGHRLNGGHDYMMHFPPGGLPPNAAFWSLTITTLATCCRESSRRTQFEFRVSHFSRRQGLGNDHCQSRESEGAKVVLTDRAGF